jgi:hypothetical protein
MKLRYQSRKVASATLLWVIAACPLLASPVPILANQRTATGAGDTPSPTDRQKCLTEAKNALGLSAEVLKCGHLNDPQVLEVIAAIRVKTITTHKGFVPISQMAVLRETHSNWTPALAVHDYITNEAGYLAMDYVDDSVKTQLFAVAFEHGIDWGGGKEGENFLIELYYIDPKGFEEGISVGVAWNPVIGRYQELDDGGDGFKPELKNPPPIRTKK